MWLLRTLYKPLYDYFEGDELWISVVGTNLVLILSYWGFSLPLLYTDITRKPKFLTKYKVQQDKNIPVDKKLVWKALKTTAFNNLIVNPAFCYWLYKTQVKIGTSFKVDEIPSLWNFLTHLLVYVVVVEIVFYYSHRLMHHPLLYKHIHKKHHEWTAPIAIICIYATPIEYLTGNALTVLLGPIVMRSHITASWLWYSIAFFSTCMTHSGYHLPFCPSPQFHDFHHLKFTSNYGSLGFLDWVHGTRKDFSGTIQEKRHKILKDFTPMHVKIPETKNIQNGH